MFNSLVAGVGTPCWSTSISQNDFFIFSFSWSCLFRERGQLSMSPPAFVSSHKDEAASKTQPGQRRNATPTTWESGWLLEHYRRETDPEWMVTYVNLVFGRTVSLKNRYSEIMLLKDFTKAQLDRCNTQCLINKFMESILNNYNIWIHKILQKILRINL